MHPSSVPGGGVAHSVRHSDTIGVECVTAEQDNSPTIRRRALLVVNRRARLGEAAHAAAVEALTSCGCEVIDGSPRGEERIADRLRELGGTADVIVVGGGDGTLNAAAEAILAVGKPLCILPLGTANDLARTLRLPADIPAACQLLSAGHTRRIDLGRVNGKHFFNAASLGLSVAITVGLSKERKARFGVFAYFVSALEAVWHWRPFVAEITVDGVRHRAKTVQVTVGNGVHYGGGLTVASDAAIDDQRLDVLSLEVRGWWELLPLLPALLSGTLNHTPRVRVFRGSQVDVRTAKPKRVNTDGELTTHTPATFEVVPRAVEVFAPPALPPAEAPAPLLPALPTIRRRHRPAVVVAVASCFFLLVAMVVSAGTPSFDDAILRGLRSPDDPAMPIGPGWLTGTVRDVTALGGYTVLTLMSLAAAGYFAVRQKWAAAVRVVAAAGGAAVCDAVKGVFARPRPAVVPHLDDVYTASFPSSHAAASAAVYLTLALVLAGRRPRLRRYLLTVAVLSSLLVGFSRVFLGVHFPTDVLGGWAVGVGWAAACEMVAVWLRSRR